MPALLDGGGSAGVPIPADAPVRIGAKVLVFGPRTVQETRDARLAIQKGINATFYWDYGFEPVQYIITGWSTVADYTIGGNLDGDMQQIRDILAQFPTPTTVQRLLIPSAGVAAPVVLKSYQISEDAQLGPGEPLYQLTFLEASASNPGQA